MKKKILSFVLAFALVFSNMATPWQHTRVKKCRFR